MREAYAKNAVILTATSLLLRAAGMVFRVWIAAHIGAAGMGLYQLIYTVYTLAVTLSTAGLSVVATRVVSELDARAPRAVRVSVSRLFVISLLLSVAASAGLYVAAPWIARVWLLDAAAVQPLRILAPSLPFMAASAIVRGFFMARREVRPNARAQMLEQCVRISVVMGILQLSGVTDPDKAVAVVVVGNTVSEALSWIYMHLCYVRAQRKAARDAQDAVTPARLCGLLAPIAAAQYVTGALHAVENIIVPACLALYLGSRETAVAQYGALKGMAMPVLFFPFSFITTLATLLLPDITAAYVQNQQRILHRLVSRVLLLTICVSGLAGGLFATFSREIGMFLYQSEEIALYLSVLGPLMPLMYLESMVDGILKGLNEQVATFRYTVLDSAVRIALIYLLLPRYGMWGFLFVMLVSNIMTSLLNLRRLLTVMHLRFAWWRWLLAPLLAACMALCLCRYVCAPLLAARLPALVWMALGALVFTACYLSVLFLCGCLRLSDFYTTKARKNSPPQY